MVKVNLPPVKTGKDETAVVADERIESGEEEERFDADDAQTREHERVSVTGSVLVFARS